MKTSTTFKGAAKPFGKSGHFNEPMRHALQAKGIKTGNFSDLGVGRFRYSFPDKSTVTVYANSIEEAKKRILEQVKIPKTNLSVIDGKITEQNLKLMLRRLNDGKMKPQDVPFPDDREGIKLTDEQVAKGKEWLMKLWKTENGTERKNNPYGYREQAALETLETIKLIDFYDDSKYGQQPHYVPLYRVEGKDTMFEYYGFGDTISIVG